jgi:hypothetical protein
MHVPYFHRLLNSERDRRCPVNEMLVPTYEDLELPYLRQALIEQEDHVALDINS